MVQLGREKLQELMSGQVTNKPDESEIIEVPKQLPKEEEEKPELEKTQEPEKKPSDDDKPRIIDPYTSMVENFKDFINSHYTIKPLGLKLMEQKPGDYLIYQGQLNNVWGWLRKTGCLFLKTGILRAILNLPNDNPLYKFFKDYSISTGSRRNDV